VGKNGKVSSVIDFGEFMDNSGSLISFVRGIKKKHPKLRVKGEDFRIA